MLNFTIARAVLLALLALALAGCAEGPPQEPAIDSEHSCDESAFITISNPDTRELHMDSWVISDGSGEYKLPEMRLPPGDTVRVWRGAGQGDDHNIYLGQPDVTWILRSGGDVVTVERRNLWDLFGRVQIYYLGYCSRDLGY